MRKNRVTYRNLSCNVKEWDRYHISKRGRLYRYYPKRKVWMVMNGTISRGRTYHVLRSSSNRIRIQASRLVALAWIPNPKNLPFVCHKDNIPTNNNYKNLYWGTQKDNIQQCVRDKRLRPQGKVLLDSKVREAIQKDYMMDNNIKLKDLEKKYNITHIYRYLSTYRRGRYKLNRVKVNSLFRDKEKGFTNKELSIKYGISKTCVSHYLNHYKNKETSKL